MDYKIISFDVGIKNLAYCLFHVKSSTDISILEWQVVDLLQVSSDVPIQSTTQSVVPSKPQHPTCCHMITVKKQQHACGKKAKYMDPNSTAPYYVCERHAKQETYKLLLPKKEYSVASLKKRPVADLRELGLSLHICETSSVKKTKDVLVQEIHACYVRKCWQPIQTQVNPMDTCASNRKIIAAVKNTKKASTVDLIVVGRKIHEYFSRCAWMRDITHVLIENQITPIANRMKTVQGMLTQEFIVHDCPTIENISSFNKLKAFSKKTDVSAVETQELPLLSTDSVQNDAYRAHKKDGITYCREKLQDYPVEWTQHFNTYGTKKDDLADAFLQGIWYIHEKLMKNTTNIKINNVNSP